MMNSFNEIIDFDFEKNKANHLVGFKNKIFVVSVILLLISGLIQLLFDQIFLYFLFSTALSFLVFFSYKFYHQKKYTLAKTIDFIISVLFCIGITLKFVLPEIGNILIIVVLIILSTVKISPFILSK